MSDLPETELFEPEEIIRIAAKGDGVTASGRFAWGAAPGDRLLPDGTLEWGEVALFVQREKHKLPRKHHEFIDDMASRSVYGREPTPKQHQYLHSLFFKLGGKIK